MEYYDGEEGNEIVVPFKEYGHYGWN